MKPQRKHQRPNEADEEKRQALAELKNREQVAADARFAAQLQRKLYEKKYGRPEEEEAGDRPTEYGRHSAASTGPMETPAPATRRHRRRSERTDRHRRRRTERDEESERSEGDNKHDEDSRSRERSEPPARKAPERRSPETKPLVTPPKLTLKSPRPPARSPSKSPPPRPPKKVVPRSPSRSPPTRPPKKVGGSKVALKEPPAEAGEAQRKGQEGQGQDQKQDQDQGQRWILGLV